MSLGPVLVYLKGTTPSTAPHKYRNMKRRLFPQSGVATRPTSRKSQRDRNHRNSYGYSSSSRLALRKNPSVSFVPIFMGCSTSDAEREIS